jgi:hypothetical protein
MLGHSQVATTARYTHLLDEPQRQAAERIGEIYAAAAAGKTAEIVPLPKRGRRK